MDCMKLVFFLSIVIHNSDVIMFLCVQMSDSRDTVLCSYPQT